MVGNIFRITVCVFVFFGVGACDSTTIQAGQPSGGTSAGEDTETNTCGTGENVFSILSVSPGSGPTSGETLVTIRGHKFEAETKVFFDDLEIPVTKRFGDTHIQIVTPSHEAGIVGVSLENPDSEVVELPDAYTFTAAHTTCADPALDTGGRNCKTFSTCDHAFSSGTYYLLSKNITTSGSCIQFSVSNSVLDLNGYTITYADAGFEGVPNHDFEIGTPGNSSLPLDWDFSSAPNADRTRDGLIFLSNEYLVKFTNAASTQTIVSDWVDIPVAGQSYAGYAVFHDCDSRGIAVERENRGEVCSGTLDCTFTPGSAGKYRLHVSVADGGECFVDLADIRPSGKYGVRFPSAVATAPVLRNGRIVEHGRGSYRGVSISNAGVSNGLLVENIYTENPGYDSQNFSTDEDNNTIRNSTFVNSSPYTVNRHNLVGPLVFSGSSSNKIYKNNFLGGQGVLFFVGGGSNNVENEVYENYFSAQATVTNHYSVTVWYGRNFDIRRNLFDQASPGILLSSGSQGHKVRENHFDLTAMACDAEYPASYTTSALRMTDYWADEQSSMTRNNVISDNIIYGTANRYPDRPDCRPSVIGWHTSYAGSGNEFLNNEIYFTSDAESWAVPVYASSLEEGYHFSNTYSSNHVLVWLGNPYSASTCHNSVFDSNTFIRTGSDDRFHVVYMGWHRDPWGDEQFNHVFLNNQYEGGAVLEDIYPMTVDGGRLDYAIKWYLDVIVENATEAATVSITSAEETVSGETDDEGKGRFALTDYYAYVADTAAYRDNPSLIEITSYTPHEVSVTYQGQTKTQSVEMTESKELVFQF